MKSTTWTVESALRLQAMCLVAEELFRDAPFSAAALRQDRSGQVRAQLVQCVVSAAASHEEVRPLSQPSDTHAVHIAFELVDFAGCSHAIPT